MLSTFQRDYPAVSILVYSGVMALLYPLFGAVSLGDRLLPTLSGMGFLFAASINTFLVMNALYAERMVRSDPPLWRARMAVAQGVGWFVAMVVLLGEPLRSVGSVIWLCAALAYGAFMAGSTRHAEMVIGSGLFDLERPLWRTSMGDFLTKWSAVGVLGVAGLVTVFAPRTEIGLFAVIIALPFISPFGVKNRTRWREREWLMVAAVAGVMLGLFAEG